MGIFDKFNKKKEDNKQEEYEIYLKKLGEQCRNAVADFEQNPPIKRIETEMGITLDYSEKSIDVLPKLLEEIKGAYEAKKIPDEYFDSCITFLGWYLGETMMENGLKELGCVWQVSDSIPGYEGVKLVYIASRNGMMHFPIAKIEKYVINGQEDIKGFYKSCFDLSK